MNNASSAFRSHLMQQFAASARAQSRPPLALLGLSSEDQADDETLLSELPLSSPPINRSASLSSLGGGYSKQRQQKSSLKKQAVGALAEARVAATEAPYQTTVTSSQWPAVDSSRKEHQSKDHVLKNHILGSLLEEGAAQPEGSHLRENDPSLSRTLVSLSLSHLLQQTPEETAKEHAIATSVLNSPLLSRPPSSTALQRFLQTRRRDSRLRESSLQSNNHRRPAVFYKAAIDRSVACGLSALSSDRKNLRFQRILAPSTTSEQLAEICYQTQLRQTKDRVKAAAKRDQWKYHIPAFLVALLSGGANEEMNDDTCTVLVDNKETGDSRSSSIYDPLPYAPPSHPDELHDYAAACTALQNILLSLHAENVGTKWLARSPLPHCPAFRDLVQAEDNERVVALVLLGEPPAIEQQQTRRVERRRKQHPSTVLGDLP